jgi:energy-coupling factor transporter ATP-binding protein EcfA2
MNINTRMLDLNINQVYNLIKTIGAKRTVLVEGHMGSGKTSIGRMLAADLKDTHTFVYFDCTTKDLMDLGAPKVMKWDETGEEYLTMVPNEELGLHLQKPIILMFDEIGKNKGIINGVRRILLERTVHGRKLHPDSIVFATTNLGAENVGDIFPAHSRNAITVVRMKKATAEEWAEDFAINAGIHPTLIAWVLREAPHVFQSFEDVTATGADIDKDVSEGGNPYIYHPKAAGRTAFFTHRSAEAASDYMHFKNEMDATTLHAALAGTVGVRAASDLISYMKIADDMPAIEDIKENPKTAKIPSNPAAVCMVIMRTLNTLDRTWVNAWMDYLVRLDPIEQALFSHSVRSEKYKHRELVMTNRKYTEWALNNQHMHQADKK